jgi:hypothetical protein
MRDLHKVGIPTRANGHHRRLWPGR